ncbi:methyltransferase domain-containing protein [Arboricoccus pini]|nr:class I SAM-dependent methyltransferase [Arboricoccus pini]
MLEPLRKDIHKLNERLDGLPANPVAGGERTGTPPVAVDINMQLHQARSAYLRQLPKNCEVFVSAGCAGLWYFEWVQECYGDIGRHLGVEYYSPKPEGLPDNVVWIENTCSDMSAVRDKEADLVFSGENMEHLWPEEVCGFYKEAARILKPGGLLVIDSPNRAITTDLNWSHPEHTVELTVDEAIELTQLSGFDITAVKGIWLCRDPATGQTLPFVPGQGDSISIVERNVMAVNDPENSFIWWIEARRNEKAVEAEALERRMSGIFAAAWPERLTRSIMGVGELRLENGEPWAVAKDGDKGALIYGPYMPLKAGRYRVTFELNKESDEMPAAVTLDVVMREPAVTLASTKIQVQPGRSTFQLEFELSQLEFGIQFRCFVHGGAGFACRRSCVLETLA